MKYMFYVGTCFIDVIASSKTTEMKTELNTNNNLHGHIIFQLFYQLSLGCHNNIISTGSALVSMVDKLNDTIHLSNSDLHNVLF